MTTEGIAPQTQTGDVAKDIKLTIEGTAAGVMAWMESLFARRKSKAERKPHKLLSDAQVSDVRRRVGAGEKPATLAAEYGVDPLTIKNHVKGKTRGVATT